MIRFSLDADKHIIAGVDATERTLDALELAKLLSQATGAPVDLVSVFPYLPLADPSGEELTRVREEARTILRELANTSGLEAADVEVVPGHAPAQALQRLSEQEDTGLLVVGSTHRGAIGRVLPGAVGERLLTGAACPVALAPRGYAEEPPTRLLRVGVAYDGSEEADGALELARVLVRAAAADLRIISVFEPMTFGAIATGRTGGASVNELLRAELRSALDEAIAGASGAGAPEGRFLEGSAAELLAAESAELDLLVTGSRRYGPRMAVLLGGTTHALMRSAACPLLVVPSSAPRGPATARPGGA
jgi:nucleotide-binding universal stress UspA family protein